MKAVIVQSQAELPDLRTWGGPVVIDTETSGLFPHHGHRICGVALCPVALPEKAFYLPLRHVGVNLGSSGSTGSGALPGPDQVQPGSPPAPYRNLAPSLIFPWLAEYLNDPGMTWVMHNAVFDLGMFRADGLEVAGPIVDTQILAHGHNSHLASYALDALTPGEHPWYVKLEAELKRAQAWKGVDGPAQKDYSLVDIALLGPYACEDVTSTARLYTRLKAQPLLPAPDNFKNPSHSQADMIEADQALVRALFEMQWAGVRMDLQALLAARHDAEDRTERAFALMRAHSGGAAFNPSSNRELSAAFMRAGGVIALWMLPKDQRGKQKRDQYTMQKAASNGTPCWNAAALFDYLEYYKEKEKTSAYQFLVAYRAYSQLHRLISTYLNAYLSAADRNGILHGSFSPDGTRTGRLSSRKPNLQNVTKSEENADAKALEDVLDPELLAGEGRAEDWRRIKFYRSSPVSIPKARRDLAVRIRSFFIARPGRRIVSIDYSSVEYRVAAYLTGDPELTKAFKDRPDLDFHQYCADLIGITRSQAKTVNFGTLYGMGASSLAGLLRIPESRAKSIRDRLYAKIPAMKRLIYRLKELGTEKGHVQNPMGRVCSVDAARGYTALNYYVQGFCGDIMRRALVRVWLLIRERGWDIFMMLTVHDEIVFDIPTGLVSVVAPQLAACMCDVPEIGLPLTCDIEVGRNWGEMVALKDWSGE